MKNKIKGADLHGEQARLCFLAIVNKAFHVADPTTRRRGAIPQSSPAFDMALWIFHGQKRNLKMGLPLNDGGVDELIDELNEIISESLKSGDHGIFSELAKAAEIVSAKLSKHARHVIIAGLKASEIIGAENELPSKNRVAEATAMTLGDSAYDVDDQTRWNEVLKDAGLKKLKWDKPFENSLTSGTKRPPKK